VVPIFYTLLAADHRAEADATDRAEPAGTATADSVHPPVEFA
jgi:hypothetical protein